MTPKQRVLKKYPDAYRSECRGIGVHLIKRNKPLRYLGSGKSPSSAWANAAKSIGAKP